MRLEAVIERSLADLGNLAISAGEDLLRREASQPAVMVLQVVPVDVSAVPLPGMDGALEAPRVIGLVLAGLELAFADGVVVADPRPAMTARDPQLSHEIQIAPGDHRRASILVERQCAMRDTVAIHGLLEELLSQGGILLVGDHPGHDEAAVQVQHHVEVEVDAASPRGQFADVPRPGLIGGPCRDAWDGMVLGSTLRTAVTALLGLTQLPVPRAERAKIDPLLQQVVIDLIHRLIPIGLAMRDLQHFRSLLGRQGPGLRAMPARR